MLCHSAIEGRNRIFEGGTQEKKWGNFEPYWILESSSGSSIQDNSSPWLPEDTSSESINFNLDAPPKSLNLNTSSQSMLKNKDQHRRAKSEIFIR